MPTLTSYDVAPLDAHESVSGADNPVAPLNGDGELGIDGGGATVVNDHTGPAVDPPLFFAIACQ